MCRKVVIVANQCHFMIAVMFMATIIYPYYYLKVHNRFKLHEGISIISPLSLAVLQVYSG